MIPRRRAAKPGRGATDHRSEQQREAACTTVTTVPDSVLPRTIVTREIGATNTSLRKRTRDPI